MSPPKKHDSSPRGQREHIEAELRTLLIVIAVATCMPACIRHRDPQTAYKHALRTFWHGDLASAASEVEQDYSEFQSVGTDWGWRFRLLEANVFTWKGKSDCVLTLLVAQPVPSSPHECGSIPSPQAVPAPPPGELAVERERLEGWAYITLEKFPEAERKLREAEELCSVSAPSSCPNVTRARGRLEMGLGHFDRAQRLFEDTLASARDRGDRFLEATALLNLSWSSLQQEHFDEAMDWSTKASRLATEIDAGYILQTTIGNMGWAHYRLGDSEKALPLFLDAEKRAKEIGADTSEVAWLTNAGYVYLDAHKYDAAEKAYVQALGLARKIDSTDDILNALMSLALVSELTGKLDEARDYADKTIALAPPEGNRLDVLYPLLVKGHVAALQHDVAQAEKIFHEIEGDPKSHVFLKWEAEHSLARLCEDENKPDAADHEYQAALSTFETARSSLKHEEFELPFPANASGIYDDYLHFLVSQGKTAEALQVAEYQRGRTLAEGLGLLKKDVLQKGTTFKPDPLNPQAIARRAGGTILFYSLGEKQSYLWAITSQKMSLFTLPPKSEIDPVVQRYRKALADQQEFLPQASADGRMLYRSLVAPAQTLLAKDAKVFIIPDGSLNTLNFETLITEDPVPGVSPHYWIDDATIADASSLRVLSASRETDRSPQRLKPHSGELVSGTAKAVPFPKPTEETYVKRAGVHGTPDARSGSLLLLGDAIAPSADYPELRKASVEMESVKKHFAAEQQQVFTREQATPIAYLTSKPDQFSYIHFVAHGTASRVSPLDSAIVLSSANKQDDSFKLYARDIIHQPLHADLVTISTCYGAGARAYSGEGLVGLSWAFLRAGAHNVIGALWEVSDVSTPQLMDGLYDSLKKGESPDAALRAAKLSLLHSKNAFNKPFYWAPFQLYTGS